MTNSEVDEKISEYVSYFTSVLCAIGRVGEFQCRPVPVLQQMLYLNALDTFAGDAFPSCGRNRDRFVLFFDDISGWEYRNRVSTTRLISYLCDKNLQDQELYRRVRDNFSCDSQAKTIKDDYCAYDLFQFARLENEKAAIQQCRFPELIWRYRNSISHEFVIPSRAVDVKELEWSEPRYLSVNGDRSLVFPTLFFARLCNTSLLMFEAWLRKNSIDPYQRLGNKQSDDW